MANEIQELKFQVGEAWKGVYSSSTAYGLANVVQDPTGLSIYRSLKSGNVGHPLSNASWWFRIIDLSSIKAESDRIAALNQAIAQDEALRVAAEELRQQHEEARIAAETQRNESEQARISAEQDRVNAESARATAEQQRITAEQGRVSAESARVQAEQARVLAETLRANAEDQRAANEQNRVAAEQQRIERAEQDHQRAESDHATYVDSLGAFDISSYHATDGVLAKYADLTAALGTNGANIPDALRKGGMSVKFVQSSDNKYVQYRLTADEWSVDTEDWTIVNEGVYVENPEFIYVKTDAEDKILWAIKTDGSIYYGAGVPQQVIDYINERIAGFSPDEYEDIVSFLGNLIDGDTLAALLSAKVDKITGKSLIDSEFAASQETIQNPEYLQATTDSEDKILEGTKTDGTKTVETPFEIQGVRQETIENPEFLRVTTDKNGNIVEATKKNGTKVLHRIESPTITKINNDIKILQHFNRIYPHSAIVSFIDDDSGQYFPETWGAIMEDTGIRVGIACIAGMMGGEVAPGTPYIQMTMEQLRGYYDNGCDVYSHSWSHPSFREASLDEIDEECRRSKIWLNQNGFTRNSDTIVYPGGMNKDIYVEGKKNVVRRYYEFGVATVDEYDGVNPEPLDYLFISRCNADNHTLEYLKERVDRAIEQNKLLVVLTHAYELMGYGATSLSPYKEVNIQRILDLIDYIQSKNILIMPLSEAIHQIYGW